MWEFLNRFLDWWFVAFSTFDNNTFSADNTFGRFAAAITMKFQQFRQVESWFLQYFHLKGKWISSIDCGLVVGVMVFRTWCMCAKFRVYCVTLDCLINMLKNGHSLCGCIRRAMGRCPGMPFRCPLQSNREEVC